MRDGRSGVQFEMSGPDAKAHFHLIEQLHRDAVESRLSEFGPIEWRLMPNSKVSQIRIIRQGSPADRSTWATVDQWMADTLEAMQSLFRPIVKTANAADWTPAVDDQMVSSGGPSDSLLLRTSAEVVPE